MCPHLGHDSGLIDEGLVFGNIIHGIEVEADGITELVSLGRHEDDICVASSLEIGAIEVHGPVLQVFNRGRFLHLSPLYDVIGQGLGPYWVMGT